MARTTKWESGHTATEDAPVEEAPAHVARTTKWDIAPVEEAVAAVARTSRWDAGHTATEGDAERTTQRSTRQDVGLVGSCLDAHLMERPDGINPEHTGGTVPRGVTTYYSAVRL